MMRNFRHFISPWFFLLSPLFVLAAVQPCGAARQRQLWVLNAYGNDVHVFDVDTLKLIKRIEVGPNPHGISATADGRTVHIALEDFRGKLGTLVWIDTKTMQITARITVGPRPNEIECTRDGKWIYVPCDDGQWWVVDGQSRQVVTKIRTGGRPHNTIISPDGRFMFLSPMGGAKRVTIVDIAAGHKVVGEIPFGNVTRPPAISPDGKLLFEQIDGLVGFQVADIAARKVIRTVEEPIAPELAQIATRSHGLAIRPGGQEIWSCNVEHKAVHIHEMASGDYKELAAIAMPGVIYWVSFTPDGKTAFVSVRSEGKVAVVDCASRRVTHLLEVGREPKRTQVVDVPQD